MRADHHAALLAQIRDRPDDDGPRLVFADALSERGDPWGELIVASCEVARLAREGVVDAERRRGLARRCRAIQEERWRERRWTFGFSLERGFCRSVTIDAAEAAQVAGYEFAVLREVKLGESGPSLMAFAGWPSLGHIDRLVLRNESHYHGSHWANPKERAARIAALARIAEGTRLSSLVLQGVLLDDDEIAALADSRLRRSLRRLAIVSGPRLAAEVDWQALEALELVGMRLAAEDITRLLRRPALDSVTSLDVSVSKLGEAGMRAILDRALPNLRVLRIWQADLEARAMATLAGSSLVHRLTGLAVGEEFTDPTAGALGAIAEAAGQLVELEVDQRSLKEAGAAEIVRSLRGPLRKLRLRGGEHGLAIVTALVNNPALRELRWLDLSGQPISREAAAVLASAELPSLEWLDLTDCRLDREAAHALACSPTLPRRVTLRLYHNGSAPDAVSETLLARFHDVRF